MDVKLMILSITSLGKNPQGVSIMDTHQEAGLIIPEEMIQGTEAQSEGDPLLVVMNDQEGGLELLRATPEIDPGPLVHTKDPVVRLLAEEDRLIPRGLGLRFTTITAEDEPDLHQMHSQGCRRR